MSSKKGLLERLGKGEQVVVAEGYVFEFERRGLLQAGPFTPEVVVERPDIVKSCHEEFVAAGSDVVLAFTHYGHRVKLELVGRVDILEELNRKALRIARQVADETGTLMAGNICNTTIYDPNKPDKIQLATQIFKEQIEWAVEEKADFIVAETFTSFNEGLLALDCIKKFGKGIPAVVTLSVLPDGNMFEGVAIGDACRHLEEAGAAVVGLNCFYGTKTIVKFMRQIRDKCKGPIACLPVPYRCDEAAPTMFHLKDPVTGETSFPIQLDGWISPRREIEEFTRDMQQIGVEYIGLCCGARPFHIRTMAETLGRKPPSSRYSPALHLHWSALNDADHEYCSKMAKAVSLKVEVK